CGGNMKESTVPSRPSPSMIRVGEKPKSYRHQAKTSTKPVQRRARRNRMAKGARKADGIAAFNRGSSIDAGSGEEEVPDILNPFQTDDAMAQLFGRPVDDEDGDEDDDEQRRKVGVFLKRYGGAQLLSQAARADEADDGGGAHIDLETKKRVAQRVGQNLRHHAVAHL